MKDLHGIDDVKKMVDSFYVKVNEDDLLSPIFNEFSKINWETHLPRMYNFWNTVLFAKGNYKGSPFQKHVPLPVNKLHFDRWLSIFNKNIDEHFFGPGANDAKNIAKTIGATFLAKLTMIK